MRDILLWFGESEFYRPAWSQDIQDEWTTHLSERKPAEKVQRTAALMNEAFPDAMVKNYDHLIRDITLPDKDDRHVLAAAIVCGASQIATFNLKDFPETELKHLGIEAVHPDELMLDLIDLNEQKALRVAIFVQSNNKRPPISWPDYLNSLRRASLESTAAKLEELNQT